jgi:hypothetical protein
MRGQVKRGEYRSLGLHGTSGREGAVRAPARVGEGRGKGSATGGPARDAGHLMGWAEGHWDKRPNGLAGRLVRLGWN